jgi:hypothetical protein
MTIESASNMTEGTRAAASVLRSDVAHLEAEVERLQRENERLADEREALMQENRDLRQEATLVRLYRAISERRTAGESGRQSASDAVPAPAAELYYRLPVSFKFADYFKHASAADLDTPTARSCLLHLLNEKLLVQVGSRLRKTDIVMRHAS